MEGLEQSGTGSSEDEMMDRMDVTSDISSSVATRVLLAVSVSKSGRVDVAQWTRWLTTQAPGNVAEIGVRLESVFTSHSSLVIVSVPTYAWVRLPERSAYQFIGFIKSGNLFPYLQATSSLAKQPPKKTVRANMARDTASHDSGYSEETTEGRAFPPFHTDNRAPPWTPYDSREDTGPLEASGLLSHDIFGSDPDDVAANSLFHLDRKLSSFGLSGPSKADVAKYMWEDGATESKMLRLSSSELIAQVHGTVQEIPSLYDAIIIMLHWTSERPAVQLSLFDYHERKHRRDRAIDLLISRLDEVGYLLRQNRTELAKGRI